MKFARIAALSSVLLVVQTLMAVAGDCTTGHGAQMKVEGVATGLSARISTNPAIVSVGSPFSASVVICGAKGTAIERFTIDATMPRHRHGMNYKPKIVSGAKHTYEASGLFFHMPGLWRFEVTVQAKQKRQRFTYDVDVK
ncbi:MAG: hypothetical protein AAF346_20430 [Pseudomonadota bacterium]